MKKVFCFVLVLVMMVTLVSTAAFAEEPGTMKLEVGSATGAAKAGEVISVAVNLTENTGYVSGVMAVEWDKNALALRGVTYSELAPDAGNEPILLIGDADKNSKVNIFDVSYIQKGLAYKDGYPNYSSIENTSLDFLLANADGNSSVNIFDASLIQKYLAHDSKAQSYGINSVPTMNNGSYRMRLGDSLNADEDFNFTGTGEFIVLSFVVLDGAAAGNYEISVTNTDFQETDLTKPDLAVTTVPGTITLS